MSFKLISKFKPMGDQPQAIKKLALGIADGVSFQTLLGVTGSGKSVTGDTPVIIRQKRRSIEMSIGDLIDTLFKRYASKIQCIEGTEILSIKDTKTSIESYSINPRTKKTSWKNIKQISRHRIPKKMYKIRTMCGREITVTGDHNFWVLRDGEMRLLQTYEIKATDYLPLPLEISSPRNNYKSIDLFAVFDGEKVFVDASSFIKKVALIKKPKEIINTLAPYFVFPSQKYYQIKSGNYRGLSLHVLRTIAKKLDVKIADNDMERIAIGSQIHRHILPQKMHITLALLQLIGFYIAEGHAEPRHNFFSISVTHPIIKDTIKKIIRSFGLVYRERQADIIASSKIHTLLLAKMCGVNAHQKRLPNFWPDLSQKQLAELLNAYFTGDGGVFPYTGEIIAVTASRQLASQLSYALLRFGIWARLHRNWGKALNSSKHKGAYYWRITISGRENVLRFKKCIGFSIKEKQKRLEELMHITRTTNVDSIPNIGTKIKLLRKKYRITQKSFARGANMPPGTLNAIELQINNPRRETFKKIIRGFKKSNIAKEDIDALQNFLNCRWTQINKVQTVTLKEKNVYDLAVKDNETFFAGHGGLFVHNTFTMASVIEKVQKPTLIMSCNKTLAAQLYQEFREFFPHNAVHYFVSYYDYYQPEAYIPQTDTFIEKEAMINEEIDRLRHAATQSLLTRKDVIIVASVSCIYGLGSPETYGKFRMTLTKDSIKKRQMLLRELSALQYQRNDTEFKRGTYRVRGSTVEIHPAYSDKVFVRVALDGDRIANITFRDIAGTKGETQSIEIFPATHYLPEPERLQHFYTQVQEELKLRLAQLKKEKKIVEYERLQRRVNYDLEMIKNTGYCNGIENYSRYLDGRNPGEPPFTLLDYFNYDTTKNLSPKTYNLTPTKDWLLFMDESHIGVPQVRGMYAGDKSRKEVLINYGFRLPSALDNRPLKATEFEQRIPQTIFVSATPGPYELQKSTEIPSPNGDGISKVSFGAFGWNSGHSDRVVEQLVRPTGLLDPEIEVRTTEKQIPNLIKEIEKRIAKKQRVLVTTLTKRMAEELADYLKEEKIKVTYLHSDIDTLERLDILNDLRKGEYDVLVGINLLREGLDLPEVSLVAILDADKEGFLRNDTTLIQTMGRAARHLEGKVIMYADTITGSMKRAIEETTRRRKIQEAYNKKNKIMPRSITKGLLRPLIDPVENEE